ncbi:MAG: hypothetical protein IIT39_13565, partial [Clostridia bacterium]|nr:hypothetical protein [Clostridia bacterium]
MSELQALTARRDELLAKIRDIEASCEGIENENNAQRVQELNLEHAQLSAQKQELSAKMSAIETNLSSINAEIAKLSGTGIDRILEAIKNQRWYFFKNKTKILLDRNTGRLYPNISIVYPKNENGSYCNNTPDMVNNMNLDGFDKWIVLNKQQVDYLISMNVNSEFPFLTNGNDNRKYICGYSAVYCSDSRGFMWLGSDYPRTTDHGLVIFYSNELIANSDYEAKASPNNPNYTEKERLQFTLDLFVQNDLWPIFDDEEITELYKKIYYEK